MGQIYATSKKYNAHIILLMFFRSFFLLSAISFSVRRKGEQKKDAAPIRARANRSKEIFAALKRLKKLNKRVLSAEKKTLKTTPPAAAGTPPEEGNPHDFPPSGGVPNGRGGILQFVVNR
jgi:hypothetical protein